MKREGEVSFRWGIPWLDWGYVVVPEFFFRHYVSAGVTGEEFRFILHLARYRFESARGVARPSLGTVAAEMGCGIRKVQRLRGSLEAKGFLRVVQHVGAASEYHFGGLAARLLEIEQKRAETGVTGDAVLGDFAPEMAQTCVTGDRGDTGDRGGVTPVTPEEQEDKKMKEQQQSLVVAFSQPLVRDLQEMGLEKWGIDALSEVWSEDQAREAMTWVGKKPDLRNPAGYLVKLAKMGLGPGDFVAPSDETVARSEAQVYDEGLARRCWERDRQPCAAVKSGAPAYTWCRLCDVFHSVVSGGRGGL